MAPVDVPALRTLLCDELEGRCGFPFVQPKRKNHIKTKLDTSLYLLVVAMETPEQNIEGELRVELKLLGKRMTEYRALKAYVRGLPNEYAYRCHVRPSGERLVYCPVIRGHDQLLAASSEHCVTAVAETIESMRSDLGDAVPELRQARP